MKTWVEPQPVKVPVDLRDSLGGHPLIAATLVKRGISNPQKAAAFLDPGCYQPTSPLELPDMSAAVERLDIAIQREESICVWGDFDVDGQTATTILVAALGSLGARVSHHIPVRATESHGVNLAVLKRIIEDGTQLVLTCDTGIGAHEAIEYARLKGVDVIVSDHHDPPATLPNALALVNPKLLPELPAHPLASLPGVGVAYQIVQALYERNGIADEMDSYLDLVALGIVADLAELTADTRYLLQRGLQVLRQTERLGLQIMCSLAELDRDQLSEEHIAFGLAPRLNALGRLSDTNEVVEFLTTTDAGKAQIFAQRLEQLNAQRKLQTDQVFQAAQDQIEREPTLLDSAALVLSHSSWPAGVVGIVASRLVERYNRPVVLLSSPAGELARGSARSISGCNISAAIATQRDLLESFGGHPMAAGLAINPDNLPAFRRGLSQAVTEQLGKAEVEATLNIDAYLPLSALTSELVADLERLAPFGPGNPALTLASKGLRLVSQTSVGRIAEHLRLLVVDKEGQSFKVIWWGGAGQALPEGIFDLAYVTRSSNYLGQPGVQVEWLDARQLEAQTEILLRKPTITIFDYRQEEHSIALLKELVVLEDMEIWAEADAKQKLSTHGIVSHNRDELNIAETLVIWTSPPSREILDQVLERLSPEKVYLFAVDPESGDIKRYLERLAGLVNHVLRRQAGIVGLDQLAAATAQTRVTVQAGIQWLSSQGHISILADDGVLLKLEHGDKDAVIPLSIRTDQLRALLQESAAFRAYYARAEAETLINPDRE
jgi:single-stranded-DNA-specific exonuclease